MLRWYLSRIPHFYSDWLWPYCEGKVCFMKLVKLLELVFILRKILVKFFIFGKILMIVFIFGRILIINHIGFVIKTIIFRVPVVGKSWFEQFWSKNIASAFINIRLRLERNTGKSLSEALIFAS